KTGQNSLNFLNFLLQMAMNGERNEGGDDAAALQEDKKLVYMWGYLPGALPQRAPLLSPVVVTVPPTVCSSGYSWKDVCGGGCGFATAISGALSSQFILRFFCSIY